MTLIAAVPFTGRLQRQLINVASEGVTSVGIEFKDLDSRIEGAVTVDGRPRAGEPVFVLNERRGDAWAVRTDQLGRFVIQGVAAGDEIAVVTVGERRTVRVDGERLGFSARSASLRGRLVLTDSAFPAAGMLVLAVPVHTSAAAARHVGQAATTYSAEDGSFFLEGLFATRYQVLVRSLSGGQTLGAMEVDLDAGPADVTLAVRLPQ